MYGKRYGKRDQLEQAFKHTLDAVHGTTLGFVRAELELALTFCQLASDAAKPSDKRARNLKNAHNAYRAALKALSKVAPSSAERGDLTCMQWKVQEALKRLSTK